MVVVAKSESGACSVTPSMTCDVSSVTMAAAVVSSVTLDVGDGSVIALVGVPSSRTVERIVVLVVTAAVVTAGAVISSWFSGTIDEAGVVNGISVGAASVGLLVAEGGSKLWESTVHLHKL